MKKNKSTLSKYTGIVLSVMLLVIVTAGVLVYVYVMSDRISKDTFSASMASRMELLVESMTKNVINIEHLDSQGAEFDDILIETDELERVSSVFDKTLNGFYDGGQVPEFEGQTGVLQKTTNKFELSTLDSAKDIWLPYKRLVDSFVASVKSDEVDSDTIAFAADYARLYERRLSREMVDLHKSNTDRANKTLKNERLVQMIGAAIIGLLFLYIVFGALRKLFLADKELEAARKETTGILETVNEGLFLLDDELTIGTQYSSQLETILGKTDIANRKLKDLLKEVISRKDYETTEEFIEQLFNPHVIEELVYDLNPLDKVRASVSDGKGGQNFSYLSFNFSRAYNNNKISNVLVSISDVTQKVELEAQLEKEREQNNEQLEMLATILQVEHNQMASFIKRVYSVFNKTNIALKRPDRTPEDLKEKLNIVFREAHSIKGESSALGLPSFTNIANDIESQVSSLKVKPNLQGNDFLPIAVLLNNLIDLNERVESLFSKVGNTSALADELGAGVGSTASSSVSNVATSVGSSSLMSNDFFANFSQEVAERNNKLVKASVVGFDNPLGLSEDKQVIVKDVTIQLLRNAVVHGIETPEERIESNKDKEGNLMLALTAAENNQCMLVVEDDGKGIDFDALRRKAEKSGMFSGQTSAVTKRQLLAFMFSSGVSTLAQHNEDAGRGVGMDIIKERVKELSGRISVNSKEGKLTRFKILFPN